MKTLHTLHYVNLKLLFCKELGMQATILLSFLTSFEKNLRKNHEDQLGEWFYCTVDRIEANLGIGMTKQAALLKILTDAGAITIKKAGVPPRRYVKINRRWQEVREDAIDQKEKDMVHTEIVEEQEEITPENEGSMLRKTKDQCFEKRRINASKNEGSYKDSIKNKKKKKEESKDSSQKVLAPAEPVNLQSASLPVGLTPSPKQVMNWWNTISKKYGLSAIMGLSPKRISHIHARMETGIDLELVEKRISESPFLRGENDRGWKIDFDWVFKSATNALKLLEGKYTNSGKTIDLRRNKHGNSGSLTLSDLPEQRQKGIKSGFRSLRYEMRRGMLIKKTNAEMLNWLFTIEQAYQDGLKFVQENSPNTVCSYENRRGLWSAQRIIDWLLNAHWVKDRDVTSIVPGSGIAKFYIKDVLKDVYQDKRLSWFGVDEAGNQL